MERSPRAINAQPRNIVRLTWAILGSRSSAMVRCPSSAWIKRIFGCTLADCALYRQLSQFGSRAAYLEHVIATQPRHAVGDDGHRYRLCDIRGCPYL